MHLRALVPAVVWIVAVAGCVGNEPARQDGPGNSAPGPPATPQGLAPPGALQVLAAKALPVPSSPVGEYAGFEPSMDVAPDGTIYVTAPARLRVPGAASQALPSWVWVSRDGGATFASVAFADRGTGIRNLPAGLEGDVGVSPAGMAYAVDLTAAGTTVARSADGGRTWELRTPNAFREAPGDRPWVEAGAGDQVVVARDQSGAVSPQGDVGDAPVVAVSSDGGRTFPTQTTLAPCTSFDGGREYQNGDIAIAPDGTIYLSLSCDGRGLEVHRSTDGGATFGAFQVRASPDIPRDFAPVAVDATGTVYVAWSEAQEQTSDAFYAWSRDAGATWSAPLRVSFHGGATMEPWIEAGDAGHVAIAFYGAPGAPGKPSEVGGDAPWFPFAVEVRDAASAQPRTFVAQMTAEPALVGPACGAGGPCPNGASPGLEDYLGVDLGPDGRVHVAWTQFPASGSGRVQWAVAAG